MEIKTCNTEFERESLRLTIDNSYILIENNGITVDFSHFALLFILIYYLIGNNHLYYKEKNGKTKFITNHKPQILLLTCRDGFNSPNDFNLGVIKTEGGLKW